MAKLTRLQVLAGTASAAIVGASRIARAQATEKIRLCAPPTDAMAPFLWAAKNGSYQKAGLDVELIPMSSGTAAATAVISGAYELGQGSSIALLAAHLKGVPVTIVGNSALWDSKQRPWAGLVVADDSPIRTGPDLDGKVVGCLALNDITTLSTSVWVDRSGGDSKTLKWVEIPGSSAGAAVATHRVVASYANEPQLGAALANDNLKMLAPVLGAIAPYYAVSLYFTRPDWAKANAGLVEKFMRTTYETVAFTNAHPAETAPTISEATKIPLSVVQSMARIHSATSSDPGLLQPVIDFASKYGNISRYFAAKELYFHA